MCESWYAQPRRSVLCGYCVGLQDNDLYQFRQTARDLKAVGTPAVSKLRSSLYSPEFREWIRSITGVGLQPPLLAPPPSPSPPTRASQPVGDGARRIGCEQACIGMGAECACVCMQTRSPCARGEPQVETNDTVDMSCAVYCDGAHLLCHDDDLAERRIAYILYFVSEVRARAAAAFSRVGGGSCRYWRPLFRWT